MVKFQLVSRIGPDVIVEEFNPYSVVAAMQVRGYPYARANVPEERLALYAQPVFEGLNGPLDGGVDDLEPIVRYECPDFREL